MKIFAICLGAMSALLAHSTVLACCVEDLRVPEAEVARLTAQAKNNDQSAMWRLYQHYSLTPDARNQAYWGERLAYLNDKRVLLDLAGFYDTLGTPYLCSRAIALVKQYASLSANPIEREAALKIARHYAGVDLPLGKCGREQRPNNSFKPNPLRGSA